MHGFAGRAVELGVRDTAARTHALQLARADLRAGSQAVFVFERPLKDPRQNFHVAVSVLAETLPRRDAVFVDDAQGTEPHVVRIVIVPERERMTRLKPTKVGESAIL